MMKRKSSLWEYLEATGVLTNGTSEEISAAKREYRRLYQRGYMREYRTGHVEVRFVVDKAIARALDAAAAANGNDRGTLAKQATLAALTENVHPTAALVNRELLQHVVLIHSEVKHLCRSRPNGFLERRIVFDRLEKRIGALEEALRGSLHKQL